MTTSTSHTDKGHTDEGHTDRATARTVTELLQQEMKEVRVAFAEMQASDDAAWDTYAAKVRASLEEMQAELEASEGRLAAERARTTAQIHEDLDSVLRGLAERLDELRVQLKLGRMDLTDRVRSVRDEADHALNAGREAVRRARAGLTKAGH